MKRSMQEVVELVIFALIALLVGTGVVWLAGWMLGLVGTVLTWLAGLVWSLLRFLVPIAVVAGAVYLLVKLMNRSAERVAGEPQKQPATPPSPWTMSKEPKEASGGEAAAASDPSRPDEPKPPATERWEGEGGSVTTGGDADEAVAASDTHEPRSEGSAPATDEAPKPSPGDTVDGADEARDEADEEDEEEDEERRRGGESG